MDEHVKATLEKLRQLRPEARPLMVVKRGSHVWGDHNPSTGPGDLDVGVVYDMPPFWYSVNGRNRTEVYAWKDEDRGLDVEAVEAWKYMVTMAKGNANWVQWLTCHPQYRGFLSERGEALMANVHEFVHMGLVRQLLRQYRSTYRQNDVGRLRLAAKAVSMLEQLRVGQRPRPELHPSLGTLVRLARKDEAYMEALKHAIGELGDGMLISEFAEIWGEVHFDRVRDVFRRMWSRGIDKHGLGG